MEDELNFLNLILFKKKKTYFILDICKKGK